MLTAVIWSKSKPDVEFQYGGRLGEFRGMSSHSHVSHCRVLPLGEVTIIIPEPHVILQGVIVPPAILKIVFAIFYFFGFFKMQFGLRRAAAFVSSPIHFFILCRCLLFLISKLLLQVAFARIARLINRIHAKPMLLTLSYLRNLPLFNCRNTSCSILNATGKSRPYLRRMPSSSSCAQPVRPNTFIMFCSVLDHMDDQSPFISVISAALR